MRTSGTTAIYAAHSAVVLLERPQNTRAGLCFVRLIPYTQGLLRKHLSVPSPKPPIRGFIPDSNALNPGIDTNDSCRLLVVIGQ